MVKIWTVAYPKEDRFSHFQSFEINGGFTYHIMKTMLGEFTGRIMFIRHFFLEGKHVIMKTRHVVFKDGHFPLKSI